MTRRVPENRGWILDPAGHRHLMTGGEIRKTGDQVETPFGKATLVVMPYPDDASEWICDLCNEQILTKWGDEPFPVAMVGNSYALCNECRLKYEKGPATGTDGEPIYITGLDGYDVVEAEGPWPFSLCICAACYLQAMIWRPFLEPEIWKNKERIASQN